MVIQEDWEGDVVTRLYFGSVVVRKRVKKTGERKMGSFFQALLPFHKVYARALLAAAKSSLKRSSESKR